VSEAEWSVATILFVDIRGFTTFADRSTARAAVDYLNDFFAVVVPIVGDHGGRVNKLLGDGLLAFFNAPGHADSGLAAGRAMLAAVHARFGDSCRIGIGINSGLVLVGTVGGGGVWEHGVIGDPVNVAARVQDATRELGEPLLITEATRLLLDAPQPMAACGAIVFRGKAAPIAIYRPAVREVIP
jgi:adenylate cyclase